MAGQSNMAGRGAVEPQDTIAHPRVLTIDKKGNWVLAKELINFLESWGIGLDCGLSFGKELIKSIDKNITVALMPCAIGEAPSNNGLEMILTRVLNSILILSRKLPWQKRKVL